MTDWMSMTTLHASNTRIPPEVYSRVACANEQVRVTHRSLPAVYLVSEADMQLLAKAKQAAFEDATERMTREYGDVLKRLAD